MKKLAVRAVCLVLALSGVSFGQGNGLISGVASVDGKALPNITVRLRNVDNGQLVGNTTASAGGEFSFSGLSPANYIVEMVSPNGTIIGTSAGVELSATAMVATNVSVGASAASVAAASGGLAAGTVAGTTAAAGAGGLSATVIAVSAVGVTLGTTAIVVVANDASPSR
jgi:hypothetical protein